MSNAVSMPRVPTFCAETPCEASLIKWVIIHHHLWQPIDSLTPCTPFYTIAIHCDPSHISMIIRDHSWSSKSWQPTVSSSPIISTPCAASPIHCTHRWSAAVIRDPPFMATNRFIDTLHAIPYYCDSLRSFAYIHDLRDHSWSSIYGNQSIHWHLARHSILLRFIAIHCDSLRFFAFIHDHPRSSMIIQIMATNHFIFANHINALRGDADSLHS